MALVHFIRGSIAQVFAHNYTVVVIFRYVKSIGWLVWTDSVKEFHGEPGLFVALEVQNLIRLPNIIELREVKASSI